MALRASSRSECAVKILDGDLAVERGTAERRLAHEEPVLERTSGRLRLGVHLEAHRAELHLGDRMMTVAPLRRRGKPDDVPGLYLAKHALELHRGEVMALVDDHLTVAGDEIGDGVLAHEALDHRDVDAARGRALRTSDLPDLLSIEAEEQRELRQPLIEKGLSMDEDQRAARSRCDEVRADHRLADARWRDEDACVVREQRASRRLLDSGQRAVEAKFELRSGHALVGDIERDAMHAEQLFEVGLAAARESQVFRQILGARDHSRRRRRRQAHALLLVELRILEGGEAFDLVQERRQGCRPSRRIVAVRVPRIRALASARVFGAGAACLREDAPMARRPPRRRQLPRCARR